MICDKSIRPSGRSYVSDVEEVADPRISTSAFSRLSVPLSDIPRCAGNASYGVWSMPSCVWCPRVATRFKESRPLDETSREIPNGRRMPKTTWGVRPR